MTDLVLMASASLATVSVGGIGLILLLIAMDKIKV
jgi:hypothetical protein